MALFKIERGTAANLVNNRPNANDGWAYFTTDDGKFYIDIAGNGTNSTPAVLTGSNKNRICLNAATADQVAHKLIIRVNDTSASSEGLNKYTFDGSDYSSHGSSSDLNIAFIADDGIDLTTPAQGSIVITNTGVTGISLNSGTRHSGNVNINTNDLIGSTAIGGPDIPVYWTGTTFAAVTGMQGATTLTIRRWTN